MKIQIKSIFEQISEKVFVAKDLKQAQQMIVEFVESKGINDKDKQMILKNTNDCKTLTKLQSYICNSLLQYEGMGMNQLNKISPEEFKTNDFIVVAISTKPIINNYHNEFYEGLINNNYELYNFKNMKIKITNKNNKSPIYIQ